MVNSTVNQNSCVYDIFIKFLSNKLFPEKSDKHLKKKTYLLYATDAATITNGRKINFSLLTLHQTTLRNLKTQVDVWRLVISFVFSLFPRLMAAPLHRAKGREVYTKRNNKTHCCSISLFRNCFPSLYNRSFVGCKTSQTQYNTWASTRSGYEKFCIWEYISVYSVRKKSDVSDETAVSIFRVEK